MPYVPSEKTDGKSQDRNLIDARIKDCSVELANNINRNQDFQDKYFSYFICIVDCIVELIKNPTVLMESPSELLVKTILDIGNSYGYEGAFLGELNYAITRLIQEVPNELVKKGKQKSAIRYYIYAYTVDALTKASFYCHYTLDNNLGLGGVFEDIKDEYKWRVNRSYEAEQILKSGDCYNTPFFTKLIEVVDDEGKTIGYTDLYLKNDGSNYKLDKLPNKIVVKKI